MGPGYLPSSGDKYPGYQSLLCDLERLPCLPRPLLPVWWGCQHTFFLGLWELSSCPEMSYCPGTNWALAPEGTG